MFANSVRLFAVQNIDIKIDPSWLVLAALIVWSLFQQYFPSAMPGEEASVYAILAIVGMLGLFASLLLHELAHSIVAQHLGVPIKSITLFLFGGVAELDSEPTTARAEFLIAAAGPLMSFCLALGFRLLEISAAWLALGIPLVEIFAYLALVNLMLGLFNLLPAVPLDGGRILRAALWAHRKDILSATRTSARLGTVLAYALMVLGIIALFQGTIIAGFWQILIGAFVLIATRASYTQQLANVVFQGVTVGELMTPDPTTVGPDVSLSELVNQITLKQHITFVPVVEEDVLLGHIESSILSKIDRENWINTRVGDVFIGLKPQNVISPDMLVHDLLEKISKTGRRKFLVAIDHRLLGVISLSDLTGHLELYRINPDQSGPP